MVWTAWITIPGKPGNGGFRQGAKAFQIHEESDRLRDA